MNRKAISAHLAGCKAADMMAYADLGDQGTVVVAPDGKKYRYSNDQLEQAEIDLKSLAKAETGSKPRRKTKRKAATKAKVGPTKKPATKPTTKPSTEPSTKPSTKSGNNK